MIYKKSILNIGILRKDKVYPFQILVLVKRLSVSVLDIGISSEIENKFKNIELVFKHYFDTEFNIQ